MNCQIGRKISIWIKSNNAKMYIRKNPLTNHVSAIIAGLAQKLII